MYLRSTQSLQSEGDINRENLIHRAIKRTLDERKVEHVKTSVSAQDLYYSQVLSFLLVSFINLDKVSKMDEILGPVYDFLLAAKPGTSQVATDMILTEFKEANQIYQVFISIMVKYY